jgi:hypothetical protein
MFSRTKVVLLGMLAVFVVSAVASTTASAKTNQPSWRVNQKLLWEGKIELKVSNTGQFPFQIEVTVLKTKAIIECKVVTGTAFIEGNKKVHGLDSGEAKFSECSLEGAAGCGVENIAATFKSSLWLHGTIKEAEEGKPKTKELQNLFEPKANNEFTKIEITKCALKGKYAVGGQTASEFSEAERDTTELKLVWTKPNQKHVHQPKTEGTGEEETQVGLIFANEPAELQGDINLTLVKPQEPEINLQNIGEEIFTGLKKIKVETFGVFKNG